MLSSSLLMRTLSSKSRRRNFNILVSRGREKKAIKFNVIAATVLERIGHRMRTQKQRKQTLEAYTYLSTQQQSKQQHDTIVRRCPSNRGDGITITLAGMERFQWSLPCRSSDGASSCLALSVPWSQVNQGSSDASVNIPTRTGAKTRRHHCDRLRFGRMCLR